MLNQYLMLFFETGILGLAGFIALAVAALAGALRAVQNGVVTGAPVAGAVAGFMVSGLFDNLLEAPRLMTLFFLVCWCGLMQWGNVPDSSNLRWYRSNSPVRRHRNPAVHSAEGPIAGPAVPTPALPIPAPD